LTDVVIDATPEKIVLFTVEDTLSILQSLLERIDVERVAEKITKVFFMASEIQGKAVLAQAKKDKLLDAGRREAPSTPPSPSPNKSAV